MHLSITMFSNSEPECSFFIIIEKYTEQLWVVVVAVVVVVVAVRWNGMNCMHRKSTIWMPIIFAKSFLLFQFNLHYIFYLHFSVQSCRNYLHNFLFACFCVCVCVCVLMLNAFLWHFSFCLFVFSNLIWNENGSTFV
jgi:hypothetical protein